MRGEIREFLLFLESAQFLVNAIALIDSFPGENNLLFTSNLVSTVYFRSFEPSREIEKRFELSRVKLYGK